MNPRPAFLNYNDWAGIHASPVLVIGETPKRYRIQTVNGSTLKLAGRSRYLRAGETALVPKTAVSFPRPDQTAQEGR